MSEDVFLDMIEDEPEDIATMSDRPTPESAGALLGIGDSVKVAEGASKWMRERGFWIDEWPESIDGMTFRVVADYTNLSGESAHWWLENDAVKDCGVHPQWLTPNAPAMPPQIGSGESSTNQ